MSNLSAERFTRYDQPDLSRCEYCGDRSCDCEPINQLESADDMAALSYVLGQL